MNTFGDNLKRLRTEAGVSQLELAYKLGVTQQRISEWERSKIEPTLFSLLNIMKALNVTFGQLAGGCIEL